MPEPTVGLVFGTGRSGIVPASAAALAPAFALLLALALALVLVLVLALLLVLVLVAEVAPGLPVGLGSSQPQIAPATHRVPSDPNWPRIELRMGHWLAWRGRAWARVYVSSLAVLAGLAPAASAQVPTPSDAARAAPARVNSESRMDCDRTATPGRVRCTVEIRLREPGTRIAWADVELVALPPFAVPLRGRLGPEDVVSKDPEAQRWAIAVLANERGRGAVRARLRFVVCDQRDRRCLPFVEPLQAELTVGDIQAP